MRTCSPCHAAVRKIAGPVEEKSGPGAIFGTYHCFICQKSFDVQVDHPHNLNVGGDLVDVVAKVRKEVGAVVECGKCQGYGGFHNCGRMNW